MKETGRQTLAKILKEYNVIYVFKKASVLLIRSRSGSNSYHNFAILKNMEFIIKATSVI